MKLILTILFFCFIFCEASVAETSPAEQFMNELEVELRLTGKRINRRFTGPNANQRKQEAVTTAYLRAISAIQRYNDLQPDLEREGFAERAVEFFKNYQKTTGIQIYQTISLKKIVPFEISSSVDDQGRRRYQQVNLKQLEFEDTYKKRATRFAKNFARQLRDFNLASLILGNLDSSSLENPMGWSQAKQTVTDPIATGTFAAFVYVNEKFTDKFGKNQTKFLPKQLVHFGGLAAGMLVSTILHELIVDVTSGDGALCRKSKSDLDPHCIKFHERWFTHDKYVSYLPEAVSLIMAAGTSGAVSSPVMKGIMASKAVSMRVMEKSKAATYLAEATKQATKKFAAKGPLAAVSVASVTALPGMVISVGNFVVFMYLHKKFAPHVNEFWKPINLNYLGWSLEESLKEKLKNKESDYVRTKRTIENELKTFESEIDNLSFYSEEKNLVKCVEDAVDRIKNHVQKVYRGNQTEHNVDYSEVLEEMKQSCIRKFYPGFVLEVESAFNKAQTELDIEEFKIKQTNWHTLIGNFSEVYEMSRSLYKKIIDAKNHSGKTTEELLKGELSKKALRGFINELRTTDPNNSGEQLIKPYNDFINGVKFGNLTDFIIYNMACGPSHEKRNVNTQREGKFENSSETEYILTPFGSSLEFIPPKVTKGNYTVCESVNLSYKNWRKNSRLKVNVDESGKKEVVYASSHQRLYFENSDVYLPIWVGSDGEKYKGLVHYILENLEDEIVNYDPNETDEFLWWEDNIHNEVEKVWDIYDETYTRLLQEKLIPKLINVKIDPDKPKKLTGRNKTRPLSTHKRLLKEHEETRYINKVIARLKKSVARLKKIVNYTKTTGYFNGMDEAKFIKEMDEFQENFIGEASYHQRLLIDWNNEVNIYDNKEDEKKSVDEIIDVLVKAEETLNTDVNLVEVRYNPLLLDLVAKDSCDKEKIHKMQNEKKVVRLFNELVWKDPNTLKSNFELSMLDPHLKNMVTFDPKESVPKGFQNLTCANKYDARRLIDRAKKEEYYSLLFGTQIEVIKSEVVEYFSLIITLTNTIGYKLVGEEE